MVLCGCREKRILAIIEARMTSKRLPGKVLADIGGQPALAVMVERLKFISELDDIVIATTSNATDNVVEALARKLDVLCWRGSEDDVLQRVLDAARHYRADIIVELTGDCPLIDPTVVSKVLSSYLDAGVDYVSNILERSFPIGMDTQVFATDVLADVARRTSDPIDREHVSLYIYRHPEFYTLRNVLASANETRPKLRLTLDTFEDLELIRSVFNALRSKRVNFSILEMLMYLDANQSFDAVNFDGESI
jgi:spore coat polysaccharide biosynthesis protein SpsF